jgi:uncharacterized membrane protein
MPLLLLINVIYPFAQRAAVLDNYGVFDSIRHGWQTVREHIGDVLILVIIFVPICIIYGMAVFAITLPLAAVALVPATVKSITSGSLRAGDFILLACGSLISALAIAFASSLLVTFRSTAITFTYQEFQTKALKSS